MDAAGNRVLKRLQAELAQHDTSSRRLFSKASAAPAQEREFQVLGAVWVLHRSGEADIPSIVGTVQFLAKDLQFIDVCLALNNLESQGFVICRRFGEGASEATPRYEITITGKREVERRTDLFAQWRKAREAGDLLDGCTERVR